MCTRLNVSMEFWNVLQVKIYVRTLFSEVPTEKRKYCFQRCFRAAAKFGMILDRDLVEEV